MAAPRDRLAEAAAAARRAGLTCDAEELAAVLPAVESVKLGLARLRARLDEGAEGDGA
jgi:hypothetical protein